MESHKEVVSIIDPTGDTVVNCCNEAGDILHGFLVSSKALSLSSPVFRVMLDPSKPYARSKAPSSDKDELKLTLGQPRLIRIIFHVLHHKNKHVPIKFPLQDLAFLAEVCDFYDLSEALKPWAIQWTQHLWVSADICRDFGLWCRMAIAFSAVDTLDEVMIELLKTSRKDEKGVILPLGESSFPCSIPETLPSKLWLKREELLGILIKQLDKTCKAYNRITFTGFSICQADYDTARRYDNSQLAAACKIGVALGYPVIDWNTVPLDETLKAFESAQDDGSEITYYKTGVSMNRGNHATCSVTGKIREIAKEVREALQRIT
ncbi:hypothetical protein TWF106_006415 [Orbilia oligospora]|uniref:BTB domain-containing protein n=1 Tax=Orbilia oligospora TaxID=2813651 RepID=A0A7C8QTI4_ORBOL|nr:hypothetical protein TWF106_006415 [Orbilia oligospora]